MFKALNELRNNARESGIREAIRIMFKKYGWKLGVAIFMYYLIRDVTLYIIIPYLVYKNLKTLLYVPYLGIFSFCVFCKTCKLI